MTPAQMLAFVESTINEVQRLQIQANDAKKASHTAAVRAQDAHDQAQAASEQAEATLQKLSQLWQSLNKVVKTQAALEQLPNP